MKEVGDGKFLQITWSFDGENVKIVHNSSNLTLGEILGLLEMEKLRVWKLDAGKEAVFYAEAGKDEQEA